MNINCYFWHLSKDPTFFLEPLDSMLFYAFFLTKIEHPNEKSWASNAGAAFVGLRAWKRMRNHQLNPSLPSLKLRVYPCKLMEDKISGSGLFLGAVLVSGRVIMRQQRSPVEQVQLDLKASSLYNFEHSRQEITCDVACAFAAWGRHFPTKYFRCRDLSL